MRRLFPHPYLSLFPASPWFLLAYLVMALILAPALAVPTTAHPPHAPRPLTHRLPKAQRQPFANRLGAAS